jgi:hypothetical protein
MTAPVVVVERLDMVEEIGPRLDPRAMASAMHPLLTRFTAST